MNRSGQMSWLANGEVDMSYIRGSPEGWGGLVSKETKLIRREPESQEGE
jgi:hypothetical protein